MQPKRQHSISKPIPLPKINARETRLRLRWNLLQKTHATVTAAKVTGCHQAQAELVR